MINCYLLNRRILHEHLRCWIVTVTYDGLSSYVYRPLVYQCILILTSPTVVRRLGDLNVGDVGGGERHHGCFGCGVFPFRAGRKQLGPKLEVNLQNNDIAGFNASETLRDSSTTRYDN